MCSSSPACAIPEAWRYWKRWRLVLPVVCTDLGGPGIIVNRICGRVVPAAGRTPRADCVKGSPMRCWKSSNAGLLDVLSQGAATRAREFTFERLVRTIYFRSRG